MHKTGSQLRRPLVIRVLLGATILLVAMLAVQLWQAGSGSAGNSKVIVNSTANTDSVSGDGTGGCLTASTADVCTLHDAIDTVNLGLADLINFNPQVFSTATPGVIDLSSGAGALPPIEREVTIDGVGRGVVLDGAGVIFPALEVDATTNAFDFSLLGGSKNFVIRDIPGDGIVLDGGITPFSFGTVVIDGVRIGVPPGDPVTGNGIDAFAANYLNMSVTNNRVTTGDEGILIFADGGPTNLIGNSTVLVDMNLVSSGGDDAVDIFYDGDLNSAINATVSNNTITSDTGIDMGFSGDAENSQINYSILNNSSITAASGDAVTVDISVCCSTDNSMVDVAVDVNGNGNLASSVGTSDEAVEVDVEICCGTSNSTSTVNVNENGNLTGDFDGVNVDTSVCCASNNMGTVGVNDNGNITGRGDDGVEVDQEVGDDGTAGQGDDNESHVTVNGNASITGRDGDGVEVDSDAGPVAFGSGGNGDNNVATIQVNDNGPIDSRDEDGADLSVDSGSTSTAASGNTGTIEVQRNTSITSTPDVAGKGIDIDIDVGMTGCCGPGNNNTGTALIAENGDIIGGDDDGIDLEITAGSQDGDAIGNTATAQILDNGDIRAAGGSDEALDFNHVEAGNNSGSRADNNTVLVEVIGNGDISTPGDEAIIGIAEAGGSEEADGNNATVIIDANGNITGGDDEDGINLEVESGNVDGSDFDADNNTAVTRITNNGNIMGDDNNGIEIDPISAGNPAGTPGDPSVNNHTVVEISGNGNIVGLQGDVDTGESGIFLDVDVCCASTNTNTVDINENGDIRAEAGSGDAGIDIDICCSVNIVSILNNNGTITGEDGDGIDYDAEIAGIATSVNILTITGNDISNSGNDSFEAGIEICCGAFELDGVGKSVISGNTITNNADDGIHVDSSFGLNIGPDNVISNNGSDPDAVAPAGIEIVNSTSAGIFGATGDVVPVNRNTITQNSIFDNANPAKDTLGIDLNGNIPINVDSGEVGCTPKGIAPIDPNNCIGHPVITLVAAGGKVGGTTCAGCTVEIFTADATPDDQPGRAPADPHVGVQHGEGRTFLESGTADGSGNFSIILPCGQGAGELTATTTDDNKNTSEFSGNAPFSGTPACATPTNTTAPTNTPTNTPIPTTPPTATPVTPSPTATPVTPTATNTPVGPTKECGDVNDSGEVNSIDALLILQIVAGLTDTVPNIESADVDQDGTITSIDAALVLQREAGLVDDLGDC